MRTFQLLVVLACWLLVSQRLTSQELSGYINGMPSVIVQQPGRDAWWQTLVHNRLNFGWQLSGFLRVDAGMRNRFITGSDALIDPRSAGFDPGWMDLSWNWLDVAGASHALPLLGNTALDRLFVTCEKNKWKIQAGRQRINWGQTFVWNPNDLFNTYSFFDFDYPERPGCDAFRGTYYHNATASSEMAVSVKHDHKVTAALLHRWNRKNVDYQLLAGEQAETDIVVGGALTSDVKGLNIRSECSYFHPVRNFSDTSGIVAASLGADYVFSNTLMIQAEVLYNNVSRTTAGMSSGMMGLYSAPLSAKYLSISDWNIFLNASYPVSPRLKSALSGMYFVDIQSFYAGFSLDYSLMENLDFSFIAQYFSVRGSANLGNMQLLMTFARLKYSF